MYRLTGGDFSKLEFITERPLLEALTWLSYELDLNETQKVKLNGNRQYKVQKLQQCNRYNNLRRRKALSNTSSNNRRHI